MKKSTSFSIGRAQDQVLTARRILIGIGAYYAFMSLLLLTDNGLLDESIFRLLIRHFPYRSPLKPHVCRRVCDIQLLSFESISRKPFLPPEHIK